MTLDDIAERLAIGKPTVWNWIKDMPEPPETPRQRAARLRAVKTVTEKYRLIREASYRQGVKEFSDLSTDPTFRDFVCMYIGEGYKRNRNRVSIGNSDPRVIELANHWLLRLASNKVSYELQYHADQDPDLLIQFWASTLGASTLNFRVQRKSNSGQLTGRTWRSKWGVLSVSASDTDLRCRIEAWIDLVKGDWISSPDTGCGAAW